MAAGKPVVILGVFVADTAYRADRQPRMGETILGNSFKLGPGGKGSNQAVAAGKLGADITFLTRLGVDAFANMAKATWKDAGVKSAVIDTPQSYTGAAYIFIEETTGNNAIIVSPGAAMLISPDDIEANAGLIGGAGVFVTQLEQPIDAALRALEIARGAGVTTILNPAPAASLPDYTTRATRPGEDGPSGLVGRRCRRAADSLLKGRRRGDHHAWRKRRAAAHGQPFHHVGAVMPASGRNHGTSAGGLPPHWREGVERYKRAPCDRRHFRDPTRHRAIDADCRRSRRCAGTSVSIVRRVASRQPDGAGCLAARPGHISHRRS